MNLQHQERLMQVVLAPVTSEKSTRVGELHNQAIFKVALNASKADIKQAVEFLFKVEVASVRTVTVKGKRKSFGRIAGRRSDWKKAYVALKPGFDINFAAG